MSSVWFWLVVIGLSIQAYHYVGYPLLLLVLAKARPRPIAKAGALPKLSLVVCAFNEADVIREKIANSLAAGYQNLEILINSEGSNDATPQIVAEYAAEGVRGVHLAERRGKSAAVNAGAAAASGEIIVFSDANAYYAPGAFAALAENFNDPAVGMVTGAKTVRPREHGQQGAAASEGTYWKYENAIKKLETASGSTVAVHGEMLAIRKQLFEPIPKGVLLDDAYLGLRVIGRGHRVVYEPRATCWEAASRTLKDDEVRRRRNVAGRYQLLSLAGVWPLAAPLSLFKYVSHKVLRLLLPVFAIIALVANIVAVMTTAPALLMQLTLLAQLAFYALAVLGMTESSWAKRLKPAQIAGFLVSGYISNLAGLWRFLGGSQSVLWERVAR